MRGSERAIAFTCATETLIGVLALPETQADTGIVIIVGGPQYRVGSHRQFVLMARRLAEAGYPVLRFDVRGMGDSSGSARSFESVDEDIAAAIDCLHKHSPTVEQVVLWGLCDGASAALLYCQATRDPRVRGLCLVNPWVRTESSLARTHVKHYYLQRVRQSSFWRKLVSGKVGVSALFASIRNLRIASRVDGPPLQHVGLAKPYQQRMAEAWAEFSGQILLVLSGRDFTAKEFVEHVERGEGWQAAFDRRGFEKHELSMADHTFSNATARDAMEGLTAAWLLKALPTVARSAPLVHDGAMR